MGDYEFQIELRSDEVNSSPVMSWVHDRVETREISNIKYSLPYRIHGLEPVGMASVSTQKYTP